MTPARAPTLGAALGGWETASLSGARVKEAKWEHEGGNRVEAEQGEPY